MQNLSFLGAIWVGLGAAIGGVLRWVLGNCLSPMWLHFPFSTLLINVLGGICMGLAAAYLESHPSVAFQQFVLVGILGGFTTFSAFSLESLHLLKSGSLVLALLHAGAHVGLALLGCALAYFVATKSLF